MLLLWGSFNKQSENKSRLIRARKKGLCMGTPVQIITIFTETISVHCNCKYLLHKYKGFCLSQKCSLLLRVSEWSKKIHFIISRWLCVIIIIVALQPACCVPPLHDLCCQRYRSQFCSSARHKIEFITGPTTEGFLSGGRIDENIANKAYEQHYTV